MHSTVRFIPDWFPGAYFKRRAKEVGRETSDVEDVPFNWAKTQIVRRICSRHSTFRRRYSPGNWWPCRVIYLKTPSFRRWTARRWGDRAEHQMVQCSTLYRWRRDCLDFLFHSMISTDPFYKDGISIEKLFLPDDYEPVCPEEGTSWYRPCCIKPPANSGWLWLTALYQSHRQRSPAVGACCAIRFLSYCNPFFSTWHLNLSKDCRTRWCKMTYMTTITSKKAPRLLRISGASSAIFFLLTYSYIPPGELHTTKKYTQIPSHLIRVGILEMMRNLTRTSLFSDSGGECALVCFHFGNREKKKSTVYFRGSLGRNVLISECIKYIGCLQHLKASGWAWCWSWADAGLGNGRHNVGPWHLLSRSCKSHEPVPDIWSPSNVEFNLVRRNTSYWSARETRIV